MILFAGDPHGSFDHLYPFLKAQKEVALVILGDLQLTTPEPLEKLAQLADLWFIHGNHDSKTVEAFEALWGTEWKQRNLHGRVQNIQGKRIAGLGGVFRGCHQINPCFLIPSIIANIVLRKESGEAVCRYVTVRQFFRQILRCWKRNKRIF